jgi:hypothetical protein
MARSGVVRRGSLQLCCRQGIGRWLMRMQWWPFVLETRWGECWASVRSCVQRQGGGTVDL